MSNCAVHEFRPFIFLSLYSCTDGEASYCHVNDTSLSEYTMLLSVLDIFTLGVKPSTVAASSHL